MHTCTHRFSCHGVCMLFACSFHICDVCVMCWRAWWPKQPAGFPQGWHVHYSLTTGTASVRSPVEAKTDSDSFSGIRLHTPVAPVSPRIISKKDFNMCLNFHSIISIGVMGSEFMKHAEGPGNLQPIGPYFQLVAAKFMAAEKLNAESWYYRIYIIEC